MQDSENKLVKLAYLAERLRHAEELNELHGNAETYMQLVDIRRRVDDAIDTVFRDAGLRVDEDSLIAAEEEAA